MFGTLGENQGSEGRVLLVGVPGKEASDGSSRAQCDENGDSIREFAEAILGW